MAVYAIGDVQGCFDQLQALVDKLAFDPAHDRLWFVGDLVNRGGQSLETLRYIKSLGEAAVVVLGNHDLHLIAQEIKPEQQRQRNPDLRRILEAEDARDLLDWLRHRPLLHHDPELNFVAVHAGLAPQWSLDAAKQHARRVEQELRGKEWPQVMLRMYGNEPTGWSRKLKGLRRTRATINIFTRMRYVDPRGKIAFDAKGIPGTQPVGYYPWFEVPGGVPRNFRMVTGHWSALGLFQGLGVYSIDTGCVWGGRLTALRLDGEDPQTVWVPGRAVEKPASTGKKPDKPVRSSGQRDKSRPANNPKPVVAAEQPVAEATSAAD
ncbi:MAG: symmetrical bis(5'-nucleosyl)-tetraphosphatase [Xanthomonadales bacterium]|nr:symmetrical bis(5'-nucleosyl)-tetraphosphatase [Xanthomonadales bacterium]